jgi:hypothetical protein
MLSEKIKIAFLSVQSATQRNDTASLSITNIYINELLEAVDKLEKENNELKKSEQ